MHNSRQLVAQQIRLRCGTLSSAYQAANSWRVGIDQEGTTDSEVFLELLQKPDCQEGQKDSSH